MKPSVPLYRPILSRALSTAWLHRELWPLAAIAGIAGTGTVLNDVLSQANTALAFPESADGAVGFVSFLQIYFSHLMAATPTNAIISFFLFSGIFLVFFFLVIGAQHTLLRALHRAATNKAVVPLKTLVAEARHPRFIRMFVINVFFKLLIVNTLLVGTMLLHTFDINGVVADAFFGFIFACTIVAVVLFFNVLSVLTLIEAAKDDTGMVASMEKAWKMIAKNPLVCLEMSAMLFGADLIFTVIYIILMVLLAVPFAVLLAVAVGVGSLGAISAVSLGFILMLLTLTISSAGFMTTFTFSAWTELAYKLAKAKAVTARVHQHAARLLAHFT
ncbi:MAG: hypothetical protein WC802_03620 [Patescibacteria group bacterium]|jgi:hypothetical protein